MIRLNAAPIVLLLALAACVPAGERTRFEIRCPDRVDTIEGDWVTRTADGRLLVRQYQVRNLDGQTVADIPNARDCRVRAVGRVGARP